MKENRKPKRGLNVGTAEALPYQDKVFDEIIIRGVLGPYAKSLPSIKEASRKKEFDGVKNL